MVQGTRAQLAGPRRQERGLRNQGLDSISRRKLITLFAVADHVLSAKTYSLPLAPISSASALERTTAEIASIQPRAPSPFAITPPPTFRTSCRLAWSEATTGLAQHQYSYSFSGFVVTSRLMATNATSDA